MNDNDIQGKLSPKTWEASEKGFWKGTPYLCLSESFLYEKEKVILYQHMVTNENSESWLYRFWNHFFSNSDLSEILAESGFEKVAFYQNVIPSGDGYNSEDITFCVAINEDNRFRNSVVSGKILI